MHELEVEIKSTRSVTCGCSLTNQPDKEADMAKNESIKLGRGFRIRLRGASYYVDYHVSGARYVRSLKTASRKDATAKACAMRASLFPAPVEFVAHLMGENGTYTAWLHSDRWAQKAWHQARHRAKRRSLPFDLVMEDLKALAERSGGVCAVTRLPFIVNGDRTYRGNPFAPSLDRVSSYLGYTRGNVRLVCLCVNMALGQWGEGVFSLMAKGYVKRLLDNPAVSPEIGSGDYTGYSDVGTDFNCEV